MIRLNEYQERELYLDESIAELNCINKKLAKLLLKKEELVEGIIAALDHSKEGQRTYEHGIYKIEVKTPYVYSLNKKRYEELGADIPDSFNPIKKSIAYSIDKRKCEDMLEIAPPFVRDLLIEIIDKKAGKPSVSIKERLS